MRPTAARCPARTALSVPARTPTFWSEDPSPKTSSSSAEGPGLAPPRAAAATRCRNTATRHAPRPRAAMMTLISSEISRELPAAEATTMHTRASVLLASAGALLACADAFQGRLETV